MGVGIAPEALRWRLQALPYPDEQLCEHHVGHGAGEMQRCAPVSISVGLVHLLLGAVGQERHHEAQIILHHGPQQLLPQRDVRLGQRGQKELLLILSPDPALLLLPARQDIVTVTAETICLGPMHKRTGASALPCEHARVSSEHPLHPPMFRIAAPLCPQQPLNLCRSTLDTCLTPACLPAPPQRSPRSLCAHTQACTAAASLSQPTAVCVHSMPEPPAPQCCVPRLRQLGDRPCAVPVCGPWPAAGKG